MKRKANSFFGFPIWIFKQHMLHSINVAPIFSHTKPMKAKKISVNFFSVFCCVYLDLAVVLKNLNSKNLKIRIGNAKKTEITGIKMF